MQHVPSLTNCEILKIEEDKGEDKHHMIRSTHPSLFQMVDAHKRKEDLCSEARDKSVHSHIQPALGHDVSLHGGTPPGRPLDWKMIKEFSQHGVPLIDLAKEGDLGGASTM